MNAFLVIWMDIVIVMEDILNIVGKTMDGRTLVMIIVGSNDVLISILHVLSCSRCTNE